MSDYNVLVYRENQTYRALAEDLKKMARVLEVESGWRNGVEFCNATYGEAVVKVFPEGASEKEIEAWLLENRAQVEGAVRFICDTTTSRVAEACDIRLKVYESGYKWFMHNRFEKILGRAVEQHCKERSSQEVYRALFALLPGAGIKRVQIVIEALGDYNPLQIEGVETWQDQREKLAEDHMQGFMALMPEGMKVERIHIQDLATPDTDTLVMCHHHATSTRGVDGDQMAKIRNGHSHIVEPYLMGLIPDMSKFCDVSSVVEEDIIGSIREYLEHPWSCVFY